MKIIITTILMTILLFSVSANAQSFGRSSGCATYDPDNCPDYTYNGYVPYVPPYFGDEVFINFPTIQPYRTGTSTIYVEGELVATPYGCDPFLIGYFNWDFNVDFISACDECPKDNVGDVNVDGVINSEDLLFLQNYYDGVGPAPSILGYADVNGDCILDINDIQVLDDFVNNMGPILAECVCPDVNNCSFQFIGDVNYDGVFDISDIVYLMAFLTQGGPTPPILSNADINGDCVINYEDAVVIELYLDGLYEPVDCTCVSPAYNTNRKPGDFNSDGVFSTADIDFFDEYLHNNGPKPLPLANGDANGDCIVNIGDSKLLNDFLFHGGLPPVDSTCFYPEYLSVCCWETRGNADYDSKDKIDISDLIVLLSYMFKDGPYPICYEEADFNGSSKIDISDLINLVSYMFQDGPYPAPCP